MDKLERVCTLLSRSLQICDSLRYSSYGQLLIVQQQIAIHVGALGIPTRLGLPPLSETFTDRVAKRSDVLLQDDLIFQLPPRIVIEAPAARHADRRSTDKWRLVQTRA